MMNSIFAIFSPRKKPRPPPSPPEGHKSPPRKTYSKKDRIRAQRALARISSGSEARSERSRLSNASSIRSPVAAARQTEVPGQHRVSEDDIYDATPEPLQIAKAPTRNAEPEPAPVSDQDTIHADHDIDVEEEQEDEGFKRFIGHHWVGDAIEIEVEWERGSPTWEPERNLHNDAPDALFAYWKSQGGRPPNPEDPDLYDIFAVRKHSKNKKKLLVEWVGFPRKDMSWLPTSVVRDTAADLLDEYWESLKDKQKA